MTDAPVRELTALLIDMITSRQGTNRIVEAAGELIAENARYNMWYRGRKGRSTLRELWNAAALGRLLTRECEAAWQAFVELGRDERREGQERLVRVVNGAAERLRTVRTTDHVDYEDPDITDDLAEELDL